MATVKHITIDYKILFAAYKNMIHLLIFKQGACYVCYFMFVLRKTCMYKGDNDDDASFISSVKFFYLIAFDTATPNLLCAHKFNNNNFNTAMCRAISF